MRCRAARCCCSRAAAARSTKQVAPHRRRSFGTSFRTTARCSSSPSIDGDRWLRLPNATVSLWGRTARTDADGVAAIRVPWRRPLHVTVGVRGYGTRTVYEDFRSHRRITVRVYRPDLQWPLYGATGMRSQAQDFIRIRPPFRTVWAVPMGGLIEFPAVVSDGVAYIGNAGATIHAISMETGTVLWSTSTPHGKMASSPAVAGHELVVHGMDGEVRVLDRATGRLRWSYHVGSPVESSPIVADGVDYFGAWNGRLYALDLRTHRLRWSRSLGAKITSSASIARRDALHRRLRGPAVGALAATRARRAGSATSTGGSTARRPSRAGACSCRRRAAAR